MLWLELRGAPDDLSFAVYVIFIKPRIIIDLFLGHEWLCLFTELGPDHGLRFVLLFQVLEYFRHFIPIENFEPIPIDQFFDFLKVVKSCLGI